MNFRSSCGERQINLPLSDLDTGVCISHHSSPCSSLISRTYPSVRIFSTSRINISAFWESFLLFELLFLPGPSFSSKIVCRSTYVSCLILLSHFCLLAGGFRMYNFCLFKILKFAVNLCSLGLANSRLLPESSEA